TLCACGTTPILTAAGLGLALARPLPPDAGPVADGNSADPLWRFLDRPGPRPAATPLGTFLNAHPGAPDPGAPSRRLFIEEAAARLRDTCADPGGLKRKDGGPVLVDPDPSHAVPLYLFDWSHTAAGPWSPHGLQLDGVQRVANATTDGDWGALTSK